MATSPLVSSSSPPLACSRGDEDIDVVGNLLGSDSPGLLEVLPVLLHELPLSLGEVLICRALILLERRERFAPGLVKLRHQRAQ